MKPENPILLARIGAAQGIRGEVRVKAFTEDPLALGDYGPLWSGDGQKFKIVNLRPYKTMVVVKFKGINSRDSAEALNGTDLFIDRSALPDDTDDDEFYIADLVGCAVFDTGGAQVGTVRAVPDFGAGAMLEIASIGQESQDDLSSTKTWLLDFSRLNVPDVDLERRRITILPPNVTDDGNETARDNSDSDGINESGD